MTAPTSFCRMKKQEIGFSDKLSAQMTNFLNKLASDIDTASARVAGSV